VQEHAAQTLNTHKRTGRGSTASTHVGLTQDILRREILAYSYPNDPVLHHKPVDLYIQPPSSSALCMEVKLGGDLDNSNAPAQLAKFVTLCMLTDKPDVRGYFATIYNKDGEGHRFTGVVTSYLADEMILAGSAFWNLILPEGVSFEHFCSLYAAAWKDVGMNDAIRALVARLVPKPRGAALDIAGHLIELAALPALPICFAPSFPRPTNDGTNCSVVAARGNSVCQAEGQRSRRKANSSITPGRGAPTRFPGPGLGGWSSGPAQRGGRSSGSGSAGLRG